MISARLQHAQRPLATPTLRLFPISVQQNHRNPLGSLIWTLGTGPRCSVHVPFPRKQPCSGFHGAKVGPNPILMYCQLFSHVTPGF